MISDLKTGKVTSNDVPAIRVFKKSGKDYSLDNRRLFAFQQAGTKVRTQPASPSEIAKEGFKFTSKNDGESIRVRGGVE